MKGLAVTVTVFLVALMLTVESSSDTQQVAEYVSAIKGFECQVLAKQDNVYVLTDGDVMFTYDGVTDNYDDVVARNAMVNDIDTLLSEDDFCYINREDVYVFAEEVYAAEPIAELTGNTPTYVKLSREDKQYVRELQFRWFGLGPDVDQVLAIIDTGEIL